jgi:hypothetical protein
LGYQLSIQPLWDRSEPPAITTTQYSGGDQFFTFKYIMKDGRVFTNTNSNANVVGAYMRSPFKYTLNVVCPITESLAGAHTYVTI